MSFVTPTVAALRIIETKLDGFLARQNEHESRIRRLERALWMVGAFAATSGGILGALITKLTGG